MKSWQLALITCAASTAGGIAIAALICVYLLYPNPWS